MKTFLSDKIREMILEGKYSGGDVLKSLKELVSEYESMMLPKEDPASFNKLLKEFSKTIKSGKYNELHIPTGYQKLDKSFGGFYKGELVVIGSRTSIGKTQFMVNLALKLSESKQVLFFSYDLPIRNLITRFLSCLTGIRAGKILKNDLLVEEKARLDKAIINLNKNKLLYCKSGRDSIYSVREICKKQVSESNVEIVFIDYLQLMGVVQHWMGRHHEIDFIVRELKFLAKEYNICIILSCQLDRSLEERGGSKTPLLSDITGPGTIEEYADKVLLLYRPSYYGFNTDYNGEDVTNMIKVIVAKNRDGKTGNFYLEIDENYAVLKDTARVVGF